MSTISAPSVAPLTRFSSPEASGVSNGTTALASARLAAKAAEAAKSSARLAGDQLATAQASAIALDQQAVRSTRAEARSADANLVSAGDLSSSLDISA